MIKLQETVKNREAWRVAVHGVAKSQKGLSDNNNRIKTANTLQKKRS